MREANARFRRSSPRQECENLENRDEYFRRLDLVVREAEKQGIGLIPSLFWHTSTVPDLVGEPLDQYGNPESKTSAFIKRCTTEHVERYKDSPAIWDWEFGNEYNHQEAPGPARRVLGPRLGPAEEGLGCELRE